ncbi:DEAD/DEAH box helicase [Cohaesibacter gelatinilyticus]|uniref:ATP-dependent RNA helicase DeaD n=1 Tax=Cohaesibacter gelatinilyticus TaxID=372072 RepID=A0A285ND83_9HYPH|nr:DEAD/DEAH box helicase [Cohaesibacter gelatinilyticus]SNZ05876.1 ATP-dependent RNA helicase DeaD [Cohaesibacter gelatinilyticus]
MTLHNAVHPSLAAALSNRGYESLTPVQTAILDADAGQRDLLVSAQTGSGKTVAFGLAMANGLLADGGRLSKAAEPLALVIAPTRELALQVKAELTWLYADCGAHIASCVGGMDMRRERRDLSAGAHIVVGTPGRLRDHIERGSLDMTWLRAAVLDEADEMLDLGFREDLEFILGAAPDERQTLLFSATVPKQIAFLAKTYQRDALRISTAEEREQHSDIEYHAHLVNSRDKEKAVINVLRYYEAQSTMVFCSTREMVRHLTSRLSNRGFGVVSLSGELSQAERSQALQAMRDGRARVCVATDVAARGIDLPNLDLVIHADLPTNSDTLLHRSGRTGRAGRKGTCVLIAPTNKRHVVNRLLKFAKLRVNWGSVPSTGDIQAKDQERIFANEHLQVTPTGDALQAAESLLALYGPEQIAAAFIASQQSMRPAPEEILDTGGSFDDKKPGRERSDFDDGVWFRLNAGRKHNAEPRWLLPMICRIGGFTKRKVGFIRILDSETVFELSGDVAGNFQDVTETEGTGEKSLRIVKLAERPKEVSGPRGGGGGRAEGRGGPRGGKPGGRGGPRGDRKGGFRKDGDRRDGDRKGGFRKDGYRKDGPKGGKKPHRGKGGKDNG